MAAAVPLARTEPFRRELEKAVPSRPFTIRFWDGSTLPATEGNGENPTFTVRSPKTIWHALLAPGQLGIGRAYVSGGLAVDDIDAAMRLLESWKPPAIDGPEKVKLAGAAVRAAGLTRPPRIPASELKPTGEAHTPERDRRAISHHYDVSNDFFALMLGESMTYSCAFFSRAESDTLESAQLAKNDLTASKLALQPGERVLDVGCGWGSFAIHAAREYGARVLGVTLSEPQAASARERVREAGVSDLVDIEVRDYRELTGEQFDAISSIGMVEHVGINRIDEYARTLASILDSGGRLLNHGIARLRHGEPDAGPFSERYVFPDAEPLHLSRITLALERAGFEPHHAEEFRMDYAETLRHWAENLDANLAEAERLIGAERLRVWRLYLRASRRGFETGFTSIFQVRATRV